MAKLNDLTGKKVGNWYVLYRSGSTRNKASVWKCRCGLCGSEKDVAGYTLISGSSTKCRSCVPRTTLSKPGRKTRLYHIYTGMKQRCTNPKQKSYSNYGFRGIKVCNEWNNSFDLFMDWATKNGYKDGLSIDRINPNGNYEPSNCRWVTSKEQSKNRRNVIHVEYKGKVYTLTDACREANVKYSSVCNYRRNNPDCTPQAVFDRFVSKSTSC